MGARMILASFILLLADICTAKPKNILFLVSDDMRPQLGAYYGRDFPAPIHPKMHTPHLDKLASHSLLLRRAHCQCATCSPSRTALLTGRRPDTTHVYDLSHYFRKVGGDFVTIPQFFKDNGYSSIGMGKVFHPGHSSSGGDDPISWSEPYWHAPAELKGSFWFEFGHNHSWYAVKPSMQEKHGKLSDEQIADRAIDTLQRLAVDGKDQQKPFFLAVGFRRPHLPFLFPEKYLDLYPESDIRLPANMYAPVNMPSIAWCDYMKMEMRNYPDLLRLNVTGGINSTFPKQVVKDLRRAYYAATSFTDDQIGRVLAELEKLGLYDDTIVSFWGDHGWSLGENGEWTKHTNFELSTHAPMMIRMPKVTDKGIQTEALTEFVDLFPTLVELAGFPKMPMCPKKSDKIKYCTEGTSLVPLMANPKRQWKRGAFSQFRRLGEKVMGYTMRTDRYRYTEWAEFHAEPKYEPDWTHLYGSEIYDHAKDPQENYNRINDPEYQSLRKQLSVLLHQGWRNALPPVSEPLRRNHDII